MKNSLIDEIISVGEYLVFFCVVRKQKQSISSRHILLNEFIQCMSTDDIDTVFVLPQHKKLFF